MKNRSNRRGSSDSDSSSASQISPKSTEPPRRHRQRASDSPRSSPEGPVEKGAATAPESGQDVVALHNRSLSTELASNVCVCQPDPKIPRPRNAFILYRQHHQPGIIAQHPGLTAPQISKIVGEQWRLQPPEIKNEWKTRAEEVKVRHQLQYPDYRYQPRRNHRKGSSTAESPSFPTPTIPCTTCGGRNATSPTTPNALNSARPMHPPHTPASAHPQSHGGYMVPMNNYGILSPQNFIPGQHPILVPVTPYPDPRQIPVDDRTTPLTADGKRRRLNSGFPYPTARQSISGPYPSASPYREVFVRADSNGTPKWPQLPPGFMGPPPRPTTNGRQAQGRQSLSLPPMRAEDQSKSVEAMVMSMPYMGKIAVLGRIAPPLRIEDHVVGTPQTRGAVIAVEGDDQDAVTATVRWLGETLGHKSEYSVRTAQGPKLPTLDREMQISDYLALLHDWHPKSREIIAFITTPPPSSPALSVSILPTTTTITDTDATDTETTPQTSPPPPSTSTTTPAPNPTTTTTTTTPPSPPRIPLVLLARYHLHASNAFASAIPIRDNYSPTDHWQWMATLWRDTVGPDLTVYIRDPGVGGGVGGTGDEGDGNGGEGDAVEVKRDVRCITVRRRKSSDAGVAGGGNGNGLKLHDAELRRLAFEIGEWARLVAKHGGKGRRGTMEDV